MKHGSPFSHAAPARERFNPARGWRASPPSEPGLPATAAGKDEVDRPPPRAPPAPHVARPEKGVQARKPKAHTHSPIATIAVRMVGQGRGRGRRLRGVGGGFKGARATRVRAHFGRRFRNRSAPFPPPLLQAQAAPGSAACPSRRVRFLLLTTALSSPSSLLAQEYHLDKQQNKQQQPNHLSLSPGSLN